MRRVRAPTGGFSAWSASAGAMIDRPRSAEEAGARRMLRTVVLSRGW